MKEERVGGLVGCGVHVTPQMLSKGGPQTFPSLKTNRPTFVFFLFFCLETIAVIHNSGSPLVAHEFTGKIAYHKLWILFTRSEIDFAIPRKTTGSWISTTKMSWIKTECNKLPMNFKEMQATITVMTPYSKYHCIRLSAKLRMNERHVLKSWESATDMKWPQPAPPCCVVQCSKVRSSLNKILSTAVLFLDGTNCYELIWRETTL